MSLTRTLPAWSLRVQGGLVILAGVYGVFRPTEFVAQGLGISLAELRGLAVRPLGHASSLPLITMGTYFCIIAQTPSMHRFASLTNVGLRLLAAGCFWQDGPAFRSVALWEMLWAAVNGISAYIADN